MTMAAESNKRRLPTEHYRLAVAVLAESLGWREKDVFYHWQQLAWLHEFECKWPRECAEWRAWRDINAVFDKRGQEPS